MTSRKALIVENDKSYLRLISGVLAGFGFKNLVVKEEAEAPQLVKQELPDLIILAVELPKVNGYIVCRRIKETEETKGIPLILISSKAKPEDFENHRKLRIRADEYLLKPFNQEDLLRKVETLIDLAPMEEKGLREEGKIPFEQRVVSEGKDLATIQEIFDKVKHKNRMVVEKLRRELKKKTDSEERLSRELAAERESFQHEKVQLETKLLKEIGQLNEEKERLERNISGLEVDMQKANQSEESNRKRLEQALTEMGELRQQDQTTMEEKSTLSEDLKREQEEKASLVSKNEALQREIEDLQKRMMEQEKEVTEVSKELESELVRKAEELQAQSAPSKKKEEALEEDLEKEISLLKEEKERLEKEAPEENGLFPEVIPPAEKQEVKERVKRSPFQLGIIGGVAALLVFSLAAFYFFRNIPSPAHPPSSPTPKPVPVVSVPPLISEKAIEKAEAEPREGKKEEEKKEEAPEAPEKKEVKTPVKVPPPPPPKKPTAKVAKKEVPRYTVQVGAYTDKAKLAKATASLKKLGIEPYTVKQWKKTKKKLYNVYLDQKYILGIANSVSMKLKIFEIKNKIIKQKDGKYSISAGSFSTRKKAEKVKRRIIDTGYPATITPKSSTQLVYLCRAGKFSTKKEADRIANTLRNSGFKPKIVELEK